tara:strand:- start:3484 stop:3807 length:324 start_codon:yes stop_codon:yes gene_type:complete
MKYDKIQGRNEAYIYTDSQERRWEVWRQATWGVDSWAMRCLEENMEIFEDAFPTRVSCIRQIVYLSQPENEFHERKIAWRYLRIRTCGSNQGRRNQELTNQKLRRKL